MKKLSDFSIGEKGVVLAPSAAKAKSDAVCSIWA